MRKGNYEIYQLSKDQSLVNNLKNKRFRPFCVCPPDVMFVTRGSKYSLFFVFDSLSNLDCGQWYKFWIYQSHPMNTPTTQKILYSFPVVLQWGTCACCNWRQHLQRLSPHGLHWPTVDEGLDTAALISVSLMLLGRRNATTCGSGNNLASISLFSISFQWWRTMPEIFSKRRMVSENKGIPFVDLFFFVLQVISVTCNFTSLWKPTLYNFVIIFPSLQMMA